MSKKHKDISTYFVSNKRSRGNTDKNDSDLLTTDSLNINNSNNNNLEVEVRSDSASVIDSSSFVSENCNNSNNLFVNNDDIGLYISNKSVLNDFSLLNRLLTKPWIPSSNYTFPKIEQNGKNRSVCQHSWLNKYSWLAYSEMYQGVYCRYCVLFSRQGNNQSVGQFINKPLRSLKDATDYLSSHDKCEYHKFSVSQATECISRYSHLNSDINLLLNDIDRQKQNENRLILASIIDCILFLGKQNIAFRGNDDDGLPDYNNGSQGNFKSLLLFRADAGDQVLQKHLKYHSKNATYMSSSVQNELIGICANSIRKCILNELINYNKFYAIIADETSDISGTEQLSISVRFVSAERNISIKEVFLGFVPLSDLSAIGITEAIVKFIKECGLDIQNVRGQGYDGASVVAGKFGGVQKLIKDIAPRAVYVHCSNHSLDLVLAYACAIQIIKTFFGTVKSIIKFINSSPKRKTMLAKAIEATNNETKRRHLVKLCETRWVDKQTSIIVFKQVYFGIIIALEYLIENGDAETSGLARAYEKSINDIDFAIPLIVVNRVFCITKPYAEQLQTPTCDLVKCYQSIEQVSIYLSELLYDDSQLDELYNEFVTFIECNEINDSLTRAASRRYKTVKNYFTDVYKTFINITIEELGKRFTEHQKLAVSISKLIPSYMIDTQFSDVLTLFNHYKDDLQTDDVNIHKAEFDTWKFTILKMKEDERPNNIHETLKMMQPVKLFYPNIYKLLELYALIPVSVAGAERSFSTLKLIKTYLRNRIGDERLSNLAIIDIHKNVIQELKIEEIIDEFAKTKRRLNFTN